MRKQSDLGFFLQFDNESLSLLQIVSRYRLRFSFASYDHALHENHPL